MKGKHTAFETRGPVKPAAVFPPRRDYVSLSIKDLLDARDAYHVYLSSLDNVIATAIGRYFIHEDDWYAKHPPGSHPPSAYRKPQSPRTLANSVIRPWSWPAVIVFVKQWERPGKLGMNAVPPSLYLPDGRVIPTCVIEAAPDTAPPPSPMLRFPTTPLIGGGYACLREHQGEENFGIVTCLVRKGGTYYALTNQHVAGGEGEVVKAYIGGQFQPVATTSRYAVDRLAMPHVFPTWNYPRSLLTMDAGLARIEDLHDWTSQAFGIGEIGELFDATEYSLTLDLIGTPVRAFNGVSGASQGEIRALFYRYESVGGFDYATDLLIGPRSKSKRDDPPHPFTGPGNSGSMWFYDPPADEDSARTSHDLHQPPAPPAERGERAPRLRPIAMQWGGDRIVSADGKKSSYVFAAFLSSVCRAMDVEVVRDWNIGHEEYWGKIGHFSIGWKACDQLSGNVGTLMKTNQSNIGFDDVKLGGTFTVDRNNFVPLADVPDYVWINTRPNEPIQHFADIDIEDIDGHPSLLDRCVSDPKNIAASAWKDYFDGFAAAGVGPEEGALPFRVWQIFDAMVGYLKKKDVIHFVAAAGVLAHYVGDASQPLHCSYMHHGVPPMTTYQGREYPYPRSSSQFTAFKTTPPAQIHGIYEEAMLEVDPVAALSLVDTKIAAMPAPSATIATGHDAAIATISLMHNAQSRLSPMDIIQADNSSLSKSKRAAALWNNATIRDATAESLAESVLTLAAIWDAAWTAGNGASIAKSKLVAFDPADLMDIYRNEKGFVPSLSLKAMATSGKFEP